VEARRRAEEELTGDPTSAAPDGSRLRRHLDGCREAAAGFFGARRCVLCPPGTGARLLLGELCAAGRVDHVVVAAPADLSVLEAVRGIAGTTVDTEMHRPGRRGLVDPEGFADALRGPRSIGCLTWGSRTSGVLQPLPQIAEAVAGSGARLLVEASTVAGRLEVDASAAEGAAMVVRSEAMGATAGLDLLLLDGPAEDLSPAPGAFRPDPGAAAGVAAAVDALSTGVEPRSRIVSELRDTLVELACRRVDGCRPLAEGAHLVPGAFLLLLEGEVPDSVHARMEAAGLRVADCDSAERLAFLRTAGLDDVSPDRVVGGCLSPGSSMVEVELFCRTLEGIVKDG
jgi:cysteine sulfinate desulfinase/cysteine desulfurase-like protein